MEKKGIKWIVERRCDEPMARHKGFFPCNHTCDSCLACIEKDINGEYSHVTKDRHQLKNVPQIR